MLLVSQSHENKADDGALLVVLSSVRAAVVISSIEKLHFQLLVLDSLLPFVPFPLIQDPLQINFQDIFSLVEHLHWVHYHLKYLRLVFFI